MLQGQKILTSLPLLLGYSIVPRRNGSGLCRTELWLGLAEQALGEQRRPNADI